MGVIRDYLPRAPEKLRYVTFHRTVILSHVPNADITGITSPVQIVA